MTWKETPRSRMLRKQESREHSPEGCEFDSRGLLTDGMFQAILGGKFVAYDGSLDDDVIVVEDDLIRANDMTIHGLFQSTNVTDFEHAESLADTPGTYVLPTPRFIPRDQVGLHWRKAQAALASPGSRAKFAQTITDLRAEQARLELLLRESRAALDLALEVHGTVPLRRMIAESDAQGWMYDDEFLEEQREIERQAEEVGA